MIVLPNQPQSHSDIFKSAYKVAKTTFFKLLPLYIILVLIHVALQFISIWFKGPEKDNNVGLLFFGLISLIILFYFIYALSASILYRINSNIQNEDSGLNNSLIFGGKTAIPIFAVGVLYALSILIGGVLFIIPGIMASVYFVFAMYLLVMGYGIIGSFKESFQLVKNHWWRTFINLLLLSLAMLGTIIIVFGLIMLFMLGVGFLIGVITAAIDPTTVNYLSDTVVIIFQAFAMFVLAVFMIMLYHYSFSFMFACLYDLKVRKTLAVDTTVLDTKKAN